MKKINNLTYLNVSEIFRKVKEYPEISNKFTKEELETLFEHGKLKGQKINDEWHSNICDVYFFFNSCENEEERSKYEYGGGIGIDLSEAKLEGKILDIGGGGEGIIGQLKGDSVIAIDPNRRELEEAPDGGIKIEMNAKDLKFLDNTFDTVTSFFTLMYIRNSEHKNVFEEIYRVIKPNGEFVLWDITIPKNIENKKIGYVVYLEVSIPQKTIHTGYGTKWTTKIQSLEYFEDLGESVGFKKIESHILGEQGYKIRFVKK